LRAIYEAPGDFAFGRAEERRLVARFFQGAAKRHQLRRAAAPPPTFRHVHYAHVENFGIFGGREPGRGVFFDEKMNRREG
jgi:hypothetical protein